MRHLSDVQRVRRFMTAIGGKASAAARVYFTGGATAVLLGWRMTTIDVDIKIVPERDEILRAIPALKESLEINVELASPGDFIPELPGWQDRSAFIATEGAISFYHYDYYAQALAKIERGHTRDTQDVGEMIARDLIEPARVMEFFNRIQPELYRFPAIDPRSFRLAVEETLKRRRGDL